MVKWKWKIIVAVLVVVLALSYLGYRGFVASSSYYYQVGEFLSQENSLGNQQVRISGTVAAGSIRQNGLDLKFIITDGEKELSVTYKGAVPDTFRASSDVTVEGRLDSSGTFIATTVLPKCASKYEPV